MKTKFQKIKFRLFKKLSKYWVLIFILFFGWMVMYEWKAQEDEQKIEVQEVKLDEQSMLIEARKQSPNLYWVKDSELRLIELNDVFVKYLLTPNGLKKEDYIGFTDFKVWDSVSAAAYQEYDKKAIDCMCPIVQVIKAPYYGDTALFVAIKYPVVFDNGSIGVGGDSKLEIIKGK